MSDEPTPLAPVQSGVEQIAAERLRGMDKEGYDAAHDDEHDRGELIGGAIAYATCTRDQILAPNPDPEHTRVMYWPFNRRTWKAGSKIRNLVKAGAMIAAEIDRLQRRGEL